MCYVTDSPPGALRNAAGGDDVLHQGREPGGDQPAPGPHADQHDQGDAGHDQRILDQILPRLRSPTPHPLISILSPAPASDAGSLPGSASLRRLGPAEPSARATIERV